MSRSRCMGGLVSLILLWAVLLPGDTAAQAAPKAVPNGGVVYHTEAIPPGATVTFLVTCPRPYAVVGGFISSGTPATLLLLSQIFNGDTWQFGMRNTSTLDVQFAVVAVICLKTPKVMRFGPKVGQIVGFNFFPVQTVPVTCPKGQAAVAAEIATQVGRSVGSAGGIQVTSVDPSGRSLIFGLRAPSPVPDSVDVGARCVRKRLGRGRESVKLKLKEFSATRQIPAGGGVVTGGCPRAIPLMAGFTTPADGRLRFLGAGVGKGSQNVSWAFDNGSGASIPADVHMLCVLGRFRFVIGLPSGGVNTRVGPLPISG